MKGLPRWIKSRLRAELCGVPIVLGKWLYPCLASALTLSVVALGGCVSIWGGGGGPPPFTVQPQVAAVAVGTSITFTTPGSIDTSQAVWNFNGTASSSLGSFTPTTGSSVVYTAPATPPLYPGSSDPLIQGTVTLRANLVGDMANTVGFHVTAPAVTAAVSPASATVAFGASQQFYGYAVGAATNGVIWQINGVNGGNAQVGTINPVGYYTAPASAPMGGNTVTLTLISTADTKATATATITLQ